MIDLSWVPMLTPPVNSALLAGILVEIWRLEKRVTYIEGRDRVRG